MGKVAIIVLLSRKELGKRIPRWPTLENVTVLDA
jgi:hypothetical protein